jgi:glycosyltransferase involved in cell wall biosynthesis
MKIAIFSDTFQINGVTTIVHQSARRLAELGHKVCIFAIGKNLEKISNANPHGNLTFISLPSLPATWVYPNERFYIPLGFSYAHIKEFAPDIIHTHLPLTVGWEAIFLAKFLKIPIIGTHHTFYDHYLKHVKMDFGWGKKLTWKYTISYYNRCDLVLSPSKSLADAMTEQGLKKPIEVLKNFIDTEVFCPANEQKKQSLKAKFGLKDKSIIYMGRLSYEKSVDQVFKAFSLVTKNNPSIRLMVVGDGPEKEKLIKLSHKLGISEKVIFTGFLRDEELTEALQANDIFISASLTESFSLTIVEAMACGLPVIAAKEKGPTEIIEDGVNGFLIPPGDPKMLAQKISELLASPKKLAEFGAASRQLAMSYSKESIIDKLEAFYKKLINKTL